MILKLDYLLFQCVGLKIDDGGCMELLPLEHIFQRLMLGMFKDNMRGFLLGGSYVYTFHFFPIPNYIQATWYQIKTSRKYLFPSFTSLLFCTFRGEKVGWKLQDVTVNINQMTFLNI